jgi:hypothetical protein
MTPVSTISMAPPQAATSAGGKLIRRRDPEDPGQDQRDQEREQRIDPAGGHRDQCCDDQTGVPPRSSWPEQLPEPRRRGFRHAELRVSLGVRPAARPASSAGVER